MAFSGADERKTTINLKAMRFLPLAQDAQPVHHVHSVGVERIIKGKHMNNLIHGHEVLQMMLASKKKYTKKSLEKDIIEKFGVSARFYTCSAENMTAKELVAFLESRGKFIAGQEGFSTDPGKICNH